jgi:hypothetical protein
MVTGKFQIVFINFKTIKTNINSATYTVDNHIGELPGVKRAIFRELNVPLIHKATTGMIVKPCISTLLIARSWTN